MLTNGAPGMGDVMCDFGLCQISRTVDVVMQFGE